MNDLRVPYRLRITSFSWQICLFFAITCSFIPNVRAATASSSPKEDPNVAQHKTRIVLLLNSFHEAASKAQFEKYFSYFAPNAVFLGTDASERWPVADFKTYVAPHFAKGNGWTYIARERHITLNDDTGKEPTFAWFDEILDSKSYGTGRGTGILIRNGDDWKIAQYSLSFPIPNDLAKKMTDDIKAFEAKARAKELEQYGDKIRAGDKAPNTDTAPAPRVEKPH